MSYTTSSLAKAARNKGVTPKAEAADKYQFYTKTSLRIRLKKIHRDLERTLDSSVSQTVLFLHAMQSLERDLNEGREVKPIMPPLDGS